MTLNRNVGVGLLSLVTILTLTPRIVAQNPQPKFPESDKLFTKKEIWQVHLRFTAAEYEAMQPRGGGFPGFGVPAKPKPPEKKDDPAREVHRNNFGMELPWAKGAVTLGGASFKDVGIRYKGNGTIGDASRTIKKSFKIELDYFGGTGQFQGHKTVNLNCEVADPSKCRETLAYALYRAAGVPASRTGLADVRLTVPGVHDQELLGVYTVVENVGKPFLRAHFGSDKGLLMKPEGLREFEYKGDDWEAYKKQYRPKRDATAAESKRIIAFTKLVHKADDDAFRKEIASYLDIDAYLRFLAVTAFVANTDSFFVLGHNYLVYLHPKTGRFHFIPWDLDRSFSNFSILGSNNQQMDLSFTHPYGGTHRLTDRLMAMPGMGERYQKLLKELSATCFSKEKLLKEVETAGSAVKDLLARDVKASAARKEGAAGFGAVNMFGRPPDLRTYVVKRTESLAAQLDGKSKGYLPASGSGFGFGNFKLGVMLAGPLLDVLDADKNDQLSRKEWLDGMDKLFAACAKDDNGRVNEKSLIAGLNKLLGASTEDAKGKPAFAFGPGNLLAGSLLRKTDANKDGTLTLDELKTGAGKLFDQFDKAKAAALDEDAFGMLLNDLSSFPNFIAPPAKGGEGKKEEKKL